MPGPCRHTSAPIIAIAFAIAFASLAACGGAPGTGARAGGGTPGARARGARGPAGVEKLLAAQHEALARGDTAAFAATLAEDVFVFGPRAVHVAASRDDVVRLMEADATAVAAHGGTLTRDVTTIAVGVGPDAKSAWVTEGLELTLVVGDERKRSTVRVTQLLAERDGVWLTVAAHWSAGVAPEDSVGRGWPALPGVGDAVAAGAEPLVAALDEAAADPEKLRALTAADALVVVAAPGEPRSGTALPAPLLRVGGARAGLAAAGVGWVAANVLDADEVAHRALFVLRERDGRWEIVQAHLSLGFGERP